MDSKNIQNTVAVFAQQLLHASNGDSLRAVGLLVLTLDRGEIFSPEEHAWRLIVDVRRVLMPDSIEDVSKPIQHLVGEASWEGMQHCLRCGKALTVTGNGHERGESLLSGYVFEIGPQLTSDPCDDYRACT